MNNRKLLPLLLSTSFMFSVFACSTEQNLNVSDLQNVSASSTQVKRSLSLAQRNELLSGRVLIGYKGTLTNQKISELKNKYGLELKFDIKKIKTAVFESKGIQAKAAISQMKNDKDLTYVGEDQAPRIDDDIKPVQVSIKDASGDPLRKDQWSLDKVEAEKAWGISKGKGVIIGIVDTGVDLEHVDLKANLLKGYNAEDDGATPPQDGGSHGTHCAGIAAAVGNNGEGMSGIAPEAKILPVRAITKGGVPEVARGIVWAVDNGAKVISLSLGWDYPSEAVIETLGKALKYGLDKNVVFTCALSNSSAYNPQSVPDNFASKPGFEGVIGVGNINVTDGKMGASGEWKSISAPGTNIISTIPGSKWGTKTGTSMATPFVAGVSALIIAKNPGIKNTEVKKLIMNTAVDLGKSGIDPDFGAGRVNPLKALN